MKRFKDILNEFRMNNEPPRNRGGGGGGDPVDQVIEFMKSVPFEHNTANGHTLHFYDSHDAASRILENRVRHEAAMQHAKGENMFYFGSSTGSHDDAMIELHDYISNHPKLPRNLEEHIDQAFATFEERAQERVRSLSEFGQIAAPTGQSGDIGRITHDRHMHSGKGEHPHLHDTAHHFQTIIQNMREDPDIGYFLHSDEM